MSWQLRRSEMVNNESSDSHETRDYSCLCSHDTRIRNQTMHRGGKNDVCFRRTRHSELEMVVGDREIGQTGRGMTGRLSATIVAQRHVEVGKVYRRCFYNTQKRLDMSVDAWPEKHPLRNCRLLADHIRSVTSR